MTILARIQPVDVRAAKNVFVSAVCFATSIGGPCPPFADNLKASAQEQVECMLSEDADAALVTADNEVKAVMKMGLSKLRVCSMWCLKIKVIEITGTFLEAVGYGNVILPATSRVRLLKSWLPYIQKLKPLLEAKGSKETDFPYKLDEELCENIEAAIVQLILALPSNDQADILTDWMKTEQVKYPDLSEAFKVWCYRAKREDCWKENWIDRQYRKQYHA